MFKSYIRNTFRVKKCLHIRKTQIKDGGEELVSLAGVLNGDSIKDLLVLIFDEVVTHACLILRKLSYCR